LLTRSPRKPTSCDRSSALDFEIDEDDDDDDDNDDKGEEEEEKIEDDAIDMNRSDKKLQSSGISGVSQAPRKEEKNRLYLS